MIDRIMIALVLMGLGIAAYQLVLRAQRRWAAAGSKRDARRANRSTLLVFTSPTCAPCKLQQLPIVERLMVDWRDKVDVDVVDVAERPEVASRYGVWSVPTTMVLDAQRNVVAINQGVAGARKLREQLAKSLGAVPAQGEHEWQFEPR